MLECLSTGIVYRNPKPYLRSVHAFHPSLVRCDATELICTYDQGDAVESATYGTHISRSRDGGVSWASEGPLLQTPRTNTTHSIRTNRLADGSLVGVGALFHRHDTDEGLLNRITSGFVPMELFLVRSRDGGRTWVSSEMIQPPIDNLAFEICHGIVELPDGRWLLPTSTQSGWDGSLPAGRSDGRVPESCRWTVVCYPMRTGYCDIDFAA